MPTTFLLIGDREDALWLQSLARALAPLGELRVVPEREAVQHFLQQSYDVVTVDAAAVGDVPLLVSRLRAQRPEARIVVATASPTWKRAREAFQAGAMNYIRKSLSEQELLCLFEDILDRSPALVPARNLGDATMTIILFADNDPEFLKTRAEFLRQEGYQVIPALNPTEARRLLERGEMNLAILDIRLENDDDEKDVSGLILAREVGHSIPKIILTGFPSHDHVREALGPQLRGLPAAVDFVAKQEGPEALLCVVRGTL